MNSRKKILIVDDEPINLDFFDLMLTKLGFIVEKAEDGMEALDRVKRFYPDLILLDNMMPRMSGWDVTRRLKADPDYREIPIIMFSAMDAVKDKIEGFELGVDDYITKPFNFSEVLARIRAVLRNRELFAQIVSRESRLRLAEAFGGDMKNNILEFLKDVDELEGAFTQAEKAGNTVESLEHFKKKTATVRKNITDLDSRIDRTIAEWRELKKNEIGIQILERNIRRSPHQD
ncbi:MAG: response regulator [Treponema sp.]|jgi:DNA-binding response OmpR family regulator|nr:response regulator [Treponema sp.]